MARHHRGPLWITCLLAYQGWRHPLDRPGTWTPIFFLDDAVALAAGHRPVASADERPTSTIGMPSPGPMDRPGRPVPAT